MEESMSPEEKAAVMQFMGQTYGQLHQQDKMIVGSSSNLQPKSNAMKQVFEQAAHMPTVNRNQPHAPAAAPPQPQPDQQPVDHAVQPVTPEQAAQEIAAQRSIRLEQPQEVKQHDPNQVEFDFSEPGKIDKLLDLIEKQNLILKDISLKLDNGKDSKVKK
tara:strand:- start:1577 stop:2056 length:480 start_codon:yes stop_codon:yes gene_type:complete